MKITMPGEKPKISLSRAEGAHFEPMRGYRDWLKIRDLGFCDATQGAIDV